MRTARVGNAILAFLILATVAAVADAAKSSVSSVYKSIKPSVVLVAAYKNGRLIGTGTGFCISSTNLRSVVATDRHVIAGADQYVVVRQYPKPQAMPARLLRVGVGLRDLALLTVKQGGIQPVTIDAGPVNEGDPIAIAGYPRTQIILGIAGLGLTSSLHTGTINALPANGFYIQYDAQTEPGNSGGPIFDSRTGFVKGIVVLKIGHNESNLGIAIDQLVEVAMNAHVTLSGPARASSCSGLSITNSNINSKRVRRSSAGSIVRGWIECV